MAGFSGILILSPLIKPPSPPPPTPRKNVVRVRPPLIGDLFHYTEPPPPTASVASKLHKRG